MQEPVDLSPITDPEAHRIIGLLLGRLDEALRELAAARTEIQRLRDEVNRLKGEQGQPTFRPPAPQRDLSSERERPKEPPPAPAPRAPLRVDREERLGLDRSTLPPDATFKELEPFVVQELVLRLETVRFLRERWHSKQAGRSYLAPLPPGYADHFGPQVKALALHLYHVGGMSEPAIWAVLTSLGLQVAASTLSGWLIGQVAAFHAEAQAVYLAGPASSPWQGIDDTKTAVNGQSEHCHVVGNPLYSSYHTRPHKDRLTIIDLLRPGQEGTYLVNQTALAYLATQRVAAYVQEGVAHLPRDTLLTQEELRQLLDTRLPQLGPQQRQWVYEATALAAYQAQTAVPIVCALLGDDAGQFDKVTVERAQCWVHDGRHYKKLLPSCWEFAALLSTFRRAYWAFYGELLAYRQAPSPAEADRLRADFVALFSTVTGYPALDARIAKTLAQQQELLLVLDHPELPLHNNDSELTARKRVRKRDVSFGPRTPAGARCWDTFQTLAATAQKLGVNFLHYLQDRLSGAHQLPSLASLITARAAEADLGASWAPPTIPQPA
jgi:Transposase IS66 family